MLKGLGDAIRNRVGIEPSVVSAPPSAVSDSPAVAILGEHFQRTFSQQHEPSVDDQGRLMIGALADLGPGLGPAVIQDEVRLAIIGSLKISGRLWVGCRLAPKREELEDAISDLFTEDQLAIGRLMIEVKEPKVGRFVLPWSWRGAAFILDSDWNDEYAFSERLWSWTKFDLEVGILVTRRDPMINDFIVQFDADFHQPINADGAVQSDSNLRGETIIVPTPVEV